MPKHRPGVSGGAPRARHAQIPFSVVRAAQLELTTLPLEVLPSDGRAVEMRATRMDKQEAATREIESTLHQAQQAITSMNKRIAG